MKLLHLLLWTALGLTLTPTASTKEASEEAAIFDSIIDLKSGEPLDLVGLQLEASLHEVGTSAFDGDLLGVMALDAPSWTKGLDFMPVDVLSGMDLGDGVRVRFLVKQLDKSSITQLELVAPVAPGIWLAADTVTGSKRLLDTADLDLATICAESFQMHSACESDEPICSWSWGSPKSTSGLAVVRKRPGRCKDDVAVTGQVRFACCLREGDALKVTILDVPTSGPFDALCNPDTSNWACE